MIFPTDYADPYADYPIDLDPSDIKPGKELFMSDYESFMKGTICIAHRDTISRI